MDMKERTVSKTGTHPHHIHRLYSVKTMQAVGSMRLSLRAIWTMQMMK